MIKILHQEDLQELTKDLGYSGHDFIYANIVNVRFTNGFQLQLKSQRGQFTITKCVEIYVEKMEDGQIAPHSTYEISCENGVFTFSINQIQTMFLRSED